MNKLHYWSDKQIIEKLKLSLCNNNIVITSTDTVLGFLGDITKESFDKITKIKGKRDNKPFLVIIDSVDKLSKFVDIKNLKKKNVNKLLEKHWPGPLTIIFKAKKDLPNFLKSRENTIAIRCPKHKGLQKILQHFDGLFSTSANKTDQPAPINYKDLDEKVLKQVQFVLIEKKNIPNTSVDTEKILYQTLPSTIIDVCNTNIKTVRKGAYPVKDLEKTYGTKFKK